MEVAAEKKGDRGMRIDRASGPALALPTATSPVQASAQIQRRVVTIADEMQRGKKRGIGSHRDEGAGERNSPFRRDEGGNL